MNEQVLNQVITDYAMENANLRVAITNLQAENRALKEQIEKADEQTEG